MPNDQTVHASAGEANDLFAETLLKIEATIEGSRSFLVGFLSTAVYLALHPLRFERLLSQSADPRRRTKPLTFMVVSVVGGSVALQTILLTLMRELGDRDNTLEVTQLAKEVFQAYAALTFGQVIVEALPITVLALLMTSSLFRFVDVEAPLQQRLAEIVSYSIGLQFSLILIASLISMPLMPVGQAHAVKVVGGIVGWIFVLYVMSIPGFIIGASLRSSIELSSLRKMAIVSIGLLVSSGLVLLDVGYLVARSAIAEALKRPEAIPIS